MGGWLAARRARGPPTTSGKARPRKRAGTTPGRGHKGGGARFRKKTATRPACASRSSKSPRASRPDGFLLPLPLAGEGRGGGADANTDADRCPHPPRSAERHSRSFASAFFSLRTAAYGGL